MPIVAKPCPKNCLFDWTDFHRKLDTALAHLIEEADTNTPVDMYLPSKTSVMTLMEFTNAKKKLQELHQFAPEETSATT